MTRTDQILALVDAYTSAAAGDSGCMDEWKALRAEVQKLEDELNERPSKRLWDETATALEVLRKKFDDHMQRCEL